MSRRRSRGHSLRRHHGLSRGGALIIFLILALLLGGIANAAPSLTGPVGFAVIVVGILCWIGAGSRGRH